MKTTKTLRIKPLGKLARFLDWCMYPVMKIVSGDLRESPQLTHNWNNHHLEEVDVEGLSKIKMTFCNGDPSAKKRFLLIYIPIFHIPIFGGWKRYVVIAPIGDMAWHIGWICRDAIGVSRIPVKGPVRVLVSQFDTYHFGIGSKGEQIPVYMRGSGRIGDGSKYRNLPLL